MYSRRLVHFGAGVFFLVLATVELVEARTGTVSFPLSVSSLAWTASGGIILGVIVLAWKGLFPPAYLVPIVAIAILVALGSGFYRTYGPIGYCGFTRETAGFPYPWTGGFVINSYPQVCPRLLQSLYLELPRFIGGPSVTVFLADVIFYVAWGLTILQLVYWARPALQRERIQL